MKRITRRTLIAGLGATALSPLLAQEFPGKPIRLIVPYPPAGASDITARLVAEKLSKKYGVQVVVENKAGANGVIGTEMIARAAPDGYTIGLVASSHVGNPYSYKRVPFDTLNDLQSITQTANVQLGLAVHPKLNANNVKDLLTLLKAQPGKVDFASTGAGGNPHLFAEVFMQLSGTKKNHVPNKGSSAAHPDLLSGEVQVMFDAVAALAPHVKSGRIKLLAVCGDKRAALLPDVPTLDEAGVKGYGMYSWGGIIAPAKLPRPLIDKLNRDIGEALRLPDVRDRLTQLGAEVVAGTPEQFDALLRSETVRYAKLIKEAGIIPE